MTTGTKDPRHAGKGIPIAVVATMFFQLAGIIWFASNMNSRINVNTSSNARTDVKIEKLGNDVDELYDAIADQNVINARLDVTIQNVNRTLESVNRRMESEAGR